MKRISLFLGFLLLALVGRSQHFEVPDQMEFAGIVLKIRNDAKGEIQKDVDALTQNQSFYLKKLALAEEYFPIIEKIFKEEGLPQDFKYLAIQESAFIPDAVSSSNAVGFWQFKKETAEEMGMRVDNKVDERMHIIASTRGAARYIQKNNYFFNNWLNALQAYQMGAGGAMDVLGDKYSGAKKMDIDKDTYWYVKRFLAHKIAFGSGIGKYQTDNYTLVEYNRGQNKTLKEIAKEANVEESLLESYNKWLKTKKIPEDENNAVIIPLKRLNNLSMIASGPKAPVPDFDKVQQRSYPRVNKVENMAYPFLVTINSLQGILAGKGETVQSITEKGNIEVDKFLRYNDLGPNAKIIEDQVYYLEKKRSRSKIYFHTVSQGENLWLISQKYGIKADNIARYNHLDKNAPLSTGLVLWLHKKRPKDTPPEIREIPVTERTVVETRPVNENQLENAASLKASDSLIIESDLENSPVAVIEDSVEVNGGKESDQIPEDPQPETITANPAQPEEILEAKEIHVVEQGETLFSISRKYGVSVQDLMNWNSLSPDSVLKMDQKLEILTKKEQNSDEQDKYYTKHIVAQGDTLYRISKEYNVSLDELLMWNNKLSSELKVGEIILIKKK